MSRSKTNKSNTPSNGVAKSKLELERRGVPASPGIVIGTAFVRDADRISVPRTLIDPSRAEVEIARLKRALDSTVNDLRALKNDIAARMGDDHARIFDAHLMILSDATLVDDTSALIKSERLNAAAAFDTVMNRF